MWSCFQKANPIAPVICRLSSISRRQKAQSSIASLAVMGSPVNGFSNTSAPNVSGVSSIGSSDPFASSRRKTGTPKSRRDEAKLIFSVGDEHRCATQHVPGVTLTGHRYDLRADGRWRVIGPKHDRVPGGRGQEPIARGFSNKHIFIRHAGLGRPISPSSSPPSEAARPIPLRECRLHRSWRTLPNGLSGNGGIPQKGTSFGCAGRPVTGPANGRATLDSDAPRVGKFSLSANAIATARPPTHTPDRAIRPVSPKRR